MELKDIAGWIEQRYMPLRRFVTTSRGAQDHGNAVRLGEDGTLDGSLWGYTEGNFTPTLTFGGGSTGITYNTGATYGRYERVGNLVRCNGRITLTNKGSSTGAAVIGGLPAALGASAALTTPLFFLATGLTLTANNQLAGICLANTATIALYEALAGAAATIDNTKFTNTTSIYFAGSYRAA